jgi:hypothetical protein
VSVCLCESVCLSGVNPVISNKRTVNTQGCLDAQEKRKKKSTSWFLFLSCYILFIVVYFQIGWHLFWFLRSVILIEVYLTTSLIPSKILGLEIFLEILQSRKKYHRLYMSLLWMIRAEITIEEFSNFYFCSNSYESALASAKA